MKHRSPTRTPVFQKYRAPCTANTRERLLPGPRSNEPGLDAPRSHFVSSLTGVSSSMGHRDPKRPRCSKAVPDLKFSGSLSPGSLVITTPNTATTTPDICCNLSPFQVTHLSHYKTFPLSSIIIFNPPLSKSNHRQKSLKINVIKKFRGLFIPHLSILLSISANKFTAGK